MLSLLLLTLALAQTPPAERPAPRGNRPVAITNNELVNMLDTYAIVQAQDFLQIADEHFGEFVTRLKRLQQIRRKNVQTRNRIIQELRKLTAPEATPDENTLRQRLKVLHDHEVSAAEELRKAYDSVDEVLDARQQARLRILEERLERQKLDLLMRARNRAAPANAPSRKPDRPPR